MANKSDGSITIDTKLDNSGFEKGSSELKHAIDSLEKRLHEVESRMSDAAYGADMQKGAQTAAKSVEEYEKAVTDFAKTCEAFDSAETFEDAYGILDQLKSKLQEFASGRYSIGGKELFGSATEAFPQMEAAIAKISGALNEAQTETQEGASGIDEYMDAMKRFANTCASFDGSSIEEARAILADLTQQLQEFGAADFNIDGLNVQGVNTQQYQAMSDALQQLQRQLDITVHGSEWVEFQDRWRSMTTLSGMVRNAFVNAFSTIGSAVRTAGAAISTAVAHPVQTLDRFLGAAATSAGRAFANLAKLAAGTIASGLGRIANMARNAAVNLGKMAAGTIRQGVSKLGASILSFGKNAKQSGAGLSLSLKNLLAFGFGISSISAILMKAREAIKDGIGALAKYDAGFGTTINNFKAALSQLKMSFTSAFAPIVEVVLPILTSLINALSMAISKVGQLMAALTGSSTYKKATISQANMAENTSAAADAMTDETKAAKEAQKTLAGFDDVEILHDNSSKVDKGQTASNASPVSVSTMPIESNLADLAGKIKDMWKNANFTGLGKELGQKLKTALDSIPWDGIKATLGKIGKSIATFLNGVLETPGLFSSIGNTLAQALNSAFEFLGSFVRNFNWASLGNAIKELILGMLNNIDWPLIYQTMTDLGAGIGTALNTVLNNPEIWSAIFTTISNGLNTAISGLNAFLTSIDWASLGANIGNGLNSGVNAFNWGSLSTLLINLINGAFSLWYNFVTTFDFYKFGSYIGTTLSNAVKGIDWAQGGASVAATINGLLNALNGFIQNTDWAALGAAVVNTIGGFFGTFEWGTLSSLLSSAVIGLFNFLVGAFQDRNWDELPGQITSAISTFLDDFDWDGVAESAGALIGEAFEAIIAIGSTLWNTLKGVGASIMDGGFEGIIDALVDVGTWITDHIFTPFIDGFKEAFGLNEGESALVSLGSSLIEGFKTGISNIWTKIRQWISTTIVEPFTTGFKSLFGLDREENILVRFGSSLIDGFKTGMSNIWAKIHAWIGNVISSPFVTAIKSVFGLDREENVLVRLGSSLINGLKTGISNIWAKIQSWIQTKVTDPFMTAIKSLLGLDKQENVLVSVGSSLIEGFKDGLKKIMQEAMDWVQTLIIDPFMSAIDKLFGLNGEQSILFDVGEKLIEGLKNGILNKMAEMGEWIETHVTGPICGFFEGLFDMGSPSKVFEGYGGYLMEGLEDGIEDNVSLPKDALSGAQTSMQTVFGSLQQLLEWSNLGTKIMSTGLKAGILLQKPFVLSEVGTLESDMRGEISNNTSLWQQAGQNAMTWLQTGINGMSWNLSYTVGTIATSIYNSFSNKGWNTLGYNIGMGIYNGLSGTDSTLSTLAWNTAVDMYNSACEALGIASPSKKFAWIGEMITAGLGDGVIDTQDSAVGAVASMAEAVTEEAEANSPIMTIDTAVSDAVSGVDSVLASFSDKIVNGFSAMISAMEDIISRSSLAYPAVASGAVTPYASRRATAQGEDDRITDALESIALRSSDRLTRNDLIEILTSVCRDYLNIDFYIGDEQIARHANAGNVRLNRRYSTVS